MESGFEDGEQAARDGRYYTTATTRRRYRALQSVAKRKASKRCRDGVSSDNSRNCRARLHLLAPARLGLRLPNIRWGCISPRHHGVRFPKFHNKKASKPSKRCGNDRIAASRLTRLPKYANGGGQVKKSFQTFQTFQSAHTVFLELWESWSMKTTVSA